MTWPSRVVVLGALALTACARFAGLQSGSYDCEVVVASNTCPGTVASGAMSVPLTGSGDLVSVLAPGPPDTSWGTIQFGAQSNPDVYDVTLGCGGEHAEIGYVGSNRFVYDLTYTLATTSCGGGATCTLHYQVTCARAP